MMMSNHPNFWLQSWRPYFLLAVVSALVYGRTLTFGFTYFDDDTLILNQFDKLQHLSMVWDAFRSIFLEAYYRPIVTLSLILDAHIGGIAPWMYHFSNVAYHVIVCCLIFYLLRRFSVSSLPALFACLLFAVHPVVTQAVAWIPGRNDTLMVMFLLLMLIAYIHYRESGAWYWLLSHWVFAGIAMLTKETALIFPGIILLYHLVIVRESWTSRTLGISAIGWPFIIIGWYVLKQSVAVGSTHLQLVSLGAIVTNFRVPLEAFGKFVLPLRMSPYPTYSLLPTIAGIVAIIAVTLFIVRHYDKEDRLRIFAIAWMILLLLPGLFVHIGDNEQRFDYLESRWYGVAIGFVMLIADLLGDRRRIFFSMRNKIMAIVFPVFGILAFNYSNTFGDPLIHWSRAVEMSPQTSNAYFKMGMVVNYVNRDPAGAAEWYRKAIQLDPNISFYHNNLGVAYGQQGFPSRAVEEYRIAVSLDSVNLMAYGNLGYSEYLNGNYDLAETYWKRILSIDSAFPNVEFKLAQLYAIRKKNKEARYHIGRLRAHGIPLDSLLNAVPNE